MQNPPADRIALIVRKLRCLRGVKAYSPAVCLFLMLRRNRLTASPRRARQGGSRGRNPRIRSVILTREIRRDNLPGSVATFVGTIFLHRCSHRDVSFSSRMHYFVCRNSRLSSGLFVFIFLTEVNYFINRYFRLNSGSLVRKFTYFTFNKDQLYSSLLRLG